MVLWSAHRRSINGDLLDDIYHFVFSGLIKFCYFLQSLCNACGIKSRKKRQAAHGIKQEGNNNKIKNNISSNDLALDNQTVKNGKGDSGNVKSKIKTVTEDCNNSKKSVKGASRFLDFGFKPERDLIVINSIMFQILQKKKQSKIKKMIVWKEVWHFYSSSCCMNYKYIIMVKKIQEMLDQISL